MTALCYFNALRELGGARRIVEDEVRANTARYGARAPAGRSAWISRSPTDDSRDAGAHLARFAPTRWRRRSNVSTQSSDPTRQPVDVALATNMISVGLDILRLGLDGRPGPAQNRCGIYPGDEPRRPRSSAAGPRRRRPQYPQAARPRALRAVRSLPSQLLSRSRGNKRDAVGGACAGPCACSDRCGGGAAHRSRAYTQDAAVKELIEPASHATVVRDAIVDARPAGAVPGGKAALATADRRSARCMDRDRRRADGKGGNAFAYARNRSPHRLLHMPLGTGACRTCPRLISGLLRAARCATSKPMSRSTRAIHGATPSPTRMTSNDQERTAIEPSGVDLRARRDGRPADALGRHRWPGALGNAGPARSRRFRNRV